MSPGKGQHPSIILRFSKNYNSKNTREIVCRKYNKQEQGRITKLLINHPRFKRKFTLIVATAIFDFPKSGPLCLPNLG